MRHWLSTFSSLAALRCISCPLARGERSQELLDHSQEVVSAFCGNGHALVMEPLAEFETDLRPSQVHLKKILVPTDFSTPSQQGLRYALRFAREFGAQVTLLHVLEKTAIGAGLEIPGRMGYADEQRTIAEKNLRALTAATEAAGGLKIGSALRDGVPADEIIETAKDFDADLILIGTHGYKGWRKALLGSTAQKVARDAPCPVLVVREKEHEFL